jgi:hypothetical protein
LEVNHSPSFNADSPLDQRIKTGVLGDLLEVELSLPGVRFITWIMLAVIN